MSLARSRRNEGLDPPQRRVQVPGMHGCAKLDVSAMASLELGVARAPRVLHIHGRQQEKALSGAGPNKRRSQGGHGAMLSGCVATG